MTWIRTDGSQNWIVFENLALNEIFSSCDVQAMVRDGTQESKFWSFCSYPLSSLHATVIHWNWKKRKHRPSESKQGTPSPFWKYKSKKNTIHSAEKFWARSQGLHAYATTKVNGSFGWKQMETVFCNMFKFTSEWWGEGCFQAMSFPVSV